MLRRLLRRAARHGRLLGIRRPFLAEVCDTVINENQSAYPELVEKRDFIKKLISVEEENFDRTIDQGLQILGALIENSEKKILSGAEAFRLNDTYGFPLDLTKEIIAEKGMTVDESEFQRLLSEQRTRARNARKNAGADAWLSESVDLDGIPATEFTGYATLKDTARILAILRDGERVESAEMNDDVVVVLDRTPFYAESGGQVGDTGFLTDGAGRFAVLDTTKHHSGVFLHHCHVVVEGLSVGSEVECVVDGIRRYNIMRNHTAAHLLQAALRKVLGTHVEQAGQLVDGQRVRFDFTHFSAMTPEEIKKVEDIVNEEIQAALPVVTEVMTIDEAKKTGAMALFGEKYGEKVRVVKMGDFSTELCGGTHVANTSTIGYFKILSEAGIAAGVRRIEALTSDGLMKHYAEVEAELHEAAKAAKTTPAALTAKIQSLLDEIKALNSENEKLKSKMANDSLGDVLSQVKEVNGVKVLASKVADVDMNGLRNLGDQLKDKIGEGVVVIASVMDGKVSLMATATDEAQKKGAHAGNLIKAIAGLVGGGGGGRPNMAQAGGKNPAGIEEALKKAVEVVEEQTK